MIDQYPKATLAALRSCAGILGVPTSVVMQHDWTTQWVFANGYPLSNQTFAALAPS